TATLAVMALKAGNVGATGATGALLDRSLIGMRNLIDRSLADVRVTAGMPPRARLISLAEFVAAVKISASLTAHAAADRIGIYGEDHCGGLPPGAAEDMFLPFKQSGEDRSGLGLGLAICRRSVEANNGVLKVRDVAGSGCVFTIELPRHVLAQISQA